MVPNVMLYPPNTLAAVVTPVAFAANGGQRWHVAHLLQLTNEGLRMERWRVALFISRSHRLFRDVLQASVEIGSIFRHCCLLPLHRVLLDVEVDVDADVGHSLACCV